MTSTCKDCGGKIVWAKNPNKKDIPLDATPKTFYRIDGFPGQYQAKPVMVRSLHFDTCASRVRSSPSSDDQG